MQPEKEARIVPRMVWGRVNLKREADREGGVVAEGGEVGGGVVVEFVLEIILTRVCRG